MRGSCILFGILYVFIFTNGFNHPGLRYLQNYWTSQVRALPHVMVNTPADPARSCGIANVGIKNMTPKDMAETLLKKYKIYTVAIDGAGVQGCRITPNIYTIPAELDVLVNALKAMG